MNTARTVWVGLGANLGDAGKTLNAALGQLSQWAAQQAGGPVLFAAASLYRSAALGAPGPDYLNTVARFESSLPALDILRYLQSLEQAFGRTRPYPNAPRVLDLDLLLAGAEQINTPELTLPHPRMLQRAFVLMPMAELEPGLQLAGRPLSDWLNACNEQHCVRLSD